MVHREEVFMPDLFLIWVFEFENPRDLSVRNLYKKLFVLNSIEENPGDLFLLLNNSAFESSACFHRVFGIT